MPNQPIGSVVKGAFILTIAAIITKILSALYRVPFQNIVGDTGFYIYQQVYPFYGIALALATAGFPLVISKIYAELTDKQERQLFMIAAAFFMGIIGLMLFVFLFYGSEWIAAFMNDESLSLLIRVVAFSFLIVPFIALLRGYFQGEGNMVPTAVSQVGEQSIRVLSILLGSIVLTYYGYDLYTVGAGAIFGSITGGIIGFFILLFFIWRSKIRIKKMSLSKNQWKKIIAMLKTLFIQGSTICISGMLLLFMQLGDALNLYRLLLEYGLSGETAKVIKGVYDRGQPLIQLGAVVATSMSLSLVPMIASKKFQKNKQDLHEMIRLAIRISLTVGLGAAAGLIAIMEPTNIMLFKNDNGTEVLAVLVMTIFVSSVIITIISVLQGLGHTVYPAAMVVIGFFIKVLLNFIFVPIFGIMGAAIASNLALLFVLIILTIRLYKTIHITLMPISFIVKICCCAILMFVAVKVLFLLFDYGFSNTSLRSIATVKALIGTGFGGIIYLATIIKLKLFTEREIILLPFGSRLLYLLPSRLRR